MPLLISLKQVYKAYDLEAHIESLLRQKDLLQTIEQHTDNKVDFADLLETYNLLTEEIERSQEKLRQLKQQTCLTVISGEKGYEEEEEEASLSSKYNIEHVIKDEKTGKLRRLKAEDLDMEKHEGVRDAFKVVYEIQKNYKLLSESKEEEEEE